MRTMSDTDENDVVEIPDGMHVGEDDNEPVIDAVLPTDDAKCPGNRVHVLYEEPGGLLTIVYERVLPEKVADPGARHKEVIEDVRLTTREACWLRRLLNQHLESDAVEEAYGGLRRSLVPAQDEYDMLRALAASLEKAYLSDDARRGFDVLKRIAGHGR